MGFVLIGFFYLCVLFSEKGFIRFSAWFEFSDGFFEWGMFVLFPMGLSGFLILFYVFSKWVLCFTDGFVSAYLYFPLFYTN